MICLKKVFLICVFISFIVINQKLFSQDYRSVFVEKYNVSKDSAKAYSDQLIISSNLSIRAFGFGAKGYLLSKEGNYTQAHENFDISFKELKKIQNKKRRLQEKIHILYYYSNLQLTEHEIEKANETINEGIQLASELDDVVMLIKFKNLVGRSFSLLGLDKKAIENGKNTITQIKTFKHKFTESSYNTTLFDAYLNTGNRTINFFLRDSLNNEAYLDSTKIYVEKAKEFVETNNIQLSSKQKRRILNLKADISFFNKKYEEAIKNYEETLEIVETSNLKKRAYQIKFRLAECYFFLGEYEKAKGLFNELDKVDLYRFKLLKNNVIIKYYYAQIYQKSGDMKLVLKYSDSFNSALEDYYKKVSNLKIDIFTNNELRSKKDQIKNLRESLSNQKETNSKLIFYLLTSVTLIILGFISIMLFIKRQKRKYKVKFDNLTNYIEVLKSNKEVLLPKRVKADKAETILSKLKAIESQNLFTDMEYSLNKVSKEIGSNSAYVSQVVNEYWDKSFVQYTNELRINYILLKLNEDNLYQKFTLLAIAESAGYKSLSSFNKHFKSITGVTPKQYFKHLRECS